MASDDLLLRVARAVRDAMNQNGQVVIAMFDEQLAALVAPFEGERREADMCAHSTAHIAASEPAPEPAASAPESGGRAAASATTATG